MKYFLKGFIGTFAALPMLVILGAYWTGALLMKFSFWLEEE